MAIVFNGTTRQIEVTDPLIFNLEAGRELYSEWKRWQQADPANAGYAPAFRTFGGDTTAPGQSAPKYYFLQNFWTVLINNGNVVSVALNLYSDDYASPYVVVAGSGVSDRNSDAVNLNSDTIEFSSFNGGTTVDATNVTGRAQPGTVFPTGTEQTPSDNLIDAYTIADSRGFVKIYVKGNLTINSGASWVGHEFTGESALKSIITINPSADVTNCEFYDCTITGTLDGNTQIERSVITGLDFVDGYVFNCALGPDTIILGTSTTANIFSSYSTVPGNLTPVIDMNGTGILALRDYNGGMKLINYTGTGSHSIDLASGNLILDSTTITSGTFIVRGVGKLVDENGTDILTGIWNTGVTIVNELLTASLVGTGGGGGTADWTDNEKKQIRDALGLDGDKRIAIGGQLQEKSELPENSIVNNN